MPVWVTRKLKDLQVQEKIDYLKFPFRNILFIYQRYLCIDTLVGRIGQLNKHRRVLTVYKYKI